MGCFPISGLITKGVTKCNKIYNKPPNTETMKLSVNINAIEIIRPPIIYVILTLVFKSFNDTIIGMVVDIRNEIIQKSINPKSQKSAEQIAIIPNRFTQKPVNIAIPSDFVVCAIANKLMKISISIMNAPINDINPSVTQNIMRGEIAKAAPSTQHKGL